MLLKTVYSILFLTLAVASSIFHIKNTDIVTVDLVFFSFTAKISWLVLFSACFGGATAFLFLLPKTLDNWRLRRRLRRFKDEKNG